MCGWRKSQMFDKEVPPRQEVLASLECWRTNNVVIYADHLVS
jgi:hypothetical protein